MDSNLNRWLTLAANVGVLIGLIVLIVEIRQNSAIAEAQFYLDQFDLNESVELAMLGDNPAVIWEKSVLDPGELSPAEIRVMEAYLVSRLYIWLNNFEMEQRGFLARGSTAANVRDSAEFFFGSRFAQNWWKYERENGNWGDAFEAIVDSGVAGIDASANRKMIELKGVPRRAIN